MRHRIGIAAIAACLVGSACVGGLAINLFQTAESLPSQRVALTLGTGLVSRENAGATEWFLTPQLRFTLGLTDRIDLGVHTGGLSPIGTANVDWLGVLVDVEFFLSRRADAFTFAWGAGVGYGLDLFGDGWGAFGQLLFESHSPIFPVFAVYRPMFPFDAGTFGLGHYLAGGLWLRLAPIARVLLMIDVYRETQSIGLSLIHI